MMSFGFVAFNGLTMSIIWFKTGYRFNNTGLGYGFRQEYGGAGNWPLSKSMEVSCKNRNGNTCANI
uniref:Uncharacterized protein n=1 Tax=Lepeophtheirus salmonis TaxID=72036 RepID=A0A0K2V5R8_LEPSM